MFNLFTYAIVFGAGLVVGVMTIFGAYKLLSDLVDLIVLTVQAKFGLPKIVKYVFAKEYADYQTVTINGVKWEVQPSPLRHVKMLKALDGTDKYLVLDEFETADLFAQHLKEDSRQMETKA